MGLRVSLDINEDKELRDYVKDLIRGQVQSIAREEVRQLILDAFTAKINATESEMEKWIREEISRRTQYDLNRAMASLLEEVKTKFREEVNKRLDEYFRSPKV